MFEKIFYVTEQEAVIELKKDVPHTADIMNMSGHGHTTKF